MDLIDKNNLLSFVEKAEGFSGKYAIVEGQIHFNETLRNNPNLGAVIAAARRRGFLSVTFHKPAEFEQKYAAGAVLKAEGDNELQEYLITLFRKAYAEKASDIHIINMGNYALIKMRILGLLIEYAQLDANTGDKLVHIVYNRFSQQQNKTLFQSTGRQDSPVVSFFLTAYIPFVYIPNPFSQNPRRPATSWPCGFCMILQKLKEHLKNE